MQTNYPGWAPRTGLREAIEQIVGAWKARL